MNNEKSLNLGTHNYGSGEGKGAKLKFA